MSVSESTQVHPRPCKTHMHTTHIKWKKQKQLLNKALIIKYLLEIYMNEERAQRAGMTPSS